MTGTGGAGSAAATPVPHQTASSIGTTTAADEAQSIVAASRSPAAGTTTRTVSQESAVRPSVSRTAPATCSAGANWKPTATTGGPTSTRLTMTADCAGRLAATRRA